MTKPYQFWFTKAVALCFKPWLKPDEAMIYCNLNRTQLLSRCRLFGIKKIAAVILTGKILIKCFRENMYRWRKDGMIF